MDCGLVWPDGLRGCADAVADAVTDAFADAFADAVADCCTDCESHSCSDAGADTHVFARRAARQQQRVRVVRIRSLQ